MAFTPLTQAEKDIMVEHICYEMQTFLEAAMHIPQLTEQRALNSAIESFGIHFRNLTDFFFWEKRSSTDDVIALECFNLASEWPAALGGIDQPFDLKAAHVAFAFERERVNKEIGHLTLKRKSIGDAGKPWKCWELANKFFPTIEIFYSTFLFNYQNRIEVRCLENSLNKYRAFAHTSGSTGATGMSIASSSLSTGSMVTSIVNPRA